MEDEAIGIEQWFAFHDQIFDVTIFDTYFENSVAFVVVSLSPQGTPRIVRKKDHNEEWGMSNHCLEGNLRLEELNNFYLNLISHDLLFYFQHESPFLGWKCFVQTGSFHFSQWTITILLFNF